MSETVKNGAFRKKRVYFSQVSNSALRDNSLSLKAKGLYALIQSYITIEGFTLYKTMLKKQCIEGEKAFESTWKELKDAGYLIQHRLQDKTKNEKGKISNTFYYEYELLDQANKSYADEIHGKQNRKRKEEKVHTPKKVVMDKNNKKQDDTHTPKTDVMDDGYDGQGGLYNNTDLNNTDLNNTKSSSSKEDDEVLLAYKNFKGTKIAPSERQLIAELVVKHGKDMVLSAIEVGVLKCNKPNFAYIQSVCQKGINIASNAQKSKSSPFTNIQNHDWDMDELEMLADEHMMSSISPN